MSSLVVSLHPIVQHHIAALRDVRTTPAEFRRVVRMLAVLLAQEATGKAAGRIGRNQNRARADIEAIKLFELSDVSRVPDGTY